jgi:membrane associated rhomboid family serine protease
MKTLAIIFAILLFFAIFGGFELLLFKELMKLPIQSQIVKTFVALGGLILGCFLFVKLLLLSEKDEEKNKKK